MALGKFADQNLAAKAVLTGGAWSPDLPLSNLKVDARYLTQPARQLTPASLISTRFFAKLERAGWVDLVALLFHTLSPKALYRLSLAAPGTPAGTWDVVGKWTSAFARTVSTGQVAYEDANWWAGEPPTDSLYPQHLFIPLTKRFMTGNVRIEIDDRYNPDGYFDIGALWITAAWSPLFNFDRGRELRAEDRSLQDEAPSGRFITEIRSRRRALSVNWSLLEDEEAYRLGDAAVRAGRSRTVLFVPDLDSPLAVTQEAWPAIFDPPPAPKFIRPGENTAAAVFREVIA